LFEKTSKQPVNQSIHQSDNQSILVFYWVPNSMVSQSIEPAPAAAAAVNQEQGFQLDDDDISGDVECDDERDNKFDMDDIDAEYILAEPVNDDGDGDVTMLQASTDTRDTGVKRTVEEQSTSSRSDKRGRTLQNRYLYMIWLLWRS
jgi:hypothetical protein